MKQYTWFHEIWTLNRVCLIYFSVPFRYRLSEWSSYLLYIAGNNIILKNELLSYRLESLGFIQMNGNISKPVVLISIGT